MGLAPLDIVPGNLYSKGLNLKTGAADKWLWGSTSGRLMVLHELPEPVLLEG
jgi:hypothetical protein